MPRPLASGPLASGSIALASGAALLIGSLVTADAQSSTTTVGNGASTTVTTRDGKPCRVVHSDDANDTGTLSSSVTAGPNGVSGKTTGGPSVTTRSGNGSTSSSVSSSSSSGGGTVVTSSGDGDCVVTVPNRK